MHFRLAVSFLILTRGFLPSASLGNVEHTTDFDHPQSTPGSLTAASRHCPGYLMSTKAPYLLSDHLETVEFGVNKTIEPTHPSLPTTILSSSDKDDDDDDDRHDAGNCQREGNSFGKSGVLPIW